MAAWPENQRGKKEGSAAKTILAPHICTDFICDFIGRNSRAERDSRPEAARRAGAAAPGKDGPFFVYYPMMRYAHGPLHATTPDKRGLVVWKDNKQENLEDMVAYMDTLVGRIAAKLDEAGIRDNTLFLFTGDNGNDTGDHSRNSTAPLCPEARARQRMPAPVLR